MDAPAQRSAPDHWVYDPLDTIPGVAREGGDGKYLLDQRAALNLFGEGVVYHTAPFPEATEITGPLTLVLWISMDVPDTDFDACGKKGMADLKSANEGGTLFGSLAQGYGAPPAVANAYKDVVSKFVHGQIKSSDEAVEQLVEAINDAK